jgi:hypothetical protein
MSKVSGMKRWDGSSWIPDTIPQAVLNIIELNAVIINSATINSPTINVPFTHASIEGSGVKSTGKLSLNGTSYSIDGNIEDYNGNPNGQNYHTELNPDGLLSYLTQTDGTTKMDVSRIAMGTLELEHLVSGLGTDATYITSSLDALKIKQLNTTGRILWSGTMVMNDVQRIMPSVPLSDCLNGWALLWSQMNSDASLSDSRFIYHIILKVFGTAQYSGNGMTFPIAAPSGSTPWANAAAKYLYVSNTTLTGYASNNQGTAYGYALREVREF